MRLQNVYFFFIAKKKKKKKTLFQTLPVLLTLFSLSRSATSFYLASSEEVDQKNLQTCREKHPKVQAQGEQSQATIPKSTYTFVCLLFQKQTEERKNVTQQSRSTDKTLNLLPYLLHSNPSDDKVQQKHTRTFFRPPGSTWPKQHSLLRSPGSTHPSLQHERDEDLNPFYLHPSILQLTRLRSYQTLST